MLFFQSYYSDRRGRDKGNTDHYIIVYTGIKNNQPVFSVGIMHIFVWHVVAGNVSVSV